MKNFPECRQIKAINGRDRMAGNRQNYQKKMEAVIAGEQARGRVTSLLLHSCCAPCSSYCLESLSEYFHITVFYYNPNIYPKEEYGKRVEEQQRLIAQLPVKYPVRFLAGDYEKERFYEAVRGLEGEREGGERCVRCFALRLREAAKTAAKLGMDYMTTTLSISPLKNAETLNEIGERAAQEYGVRYLNSDFKKKNGYKRSVELSAEYGLYRQDYCGCVFSMREREAAERAKTAEREAAEKKND